MKDKVFIESSGRKHVILVLVLIISLLILSGNIRAVNASPSSKYNITGFGAIGDGKTMNTQFIQSAIDACSKDGGGVVVVPEGIFITGALFLKQGVDLNVEKNGTLKGSVRQADYKQINTRWEGIERIWTSALINIIDVNNVKIYGEGTIDGSGTEWPGFGSRNSQPRQQLSQAARDSLSRIPRVGRPRLICFQNCNKVRISDLRIRNQSVWGLHILYCSDVVVKNLDIRAAHTIPSSDGIDVDCDVDSGNWAPIRFKTQPSRSGVVENIVYKNIRIQDAKQAFEFNLEWRMVPPIAPPAEVLPVVRNIRFINVSGKVNYLGVIHGLDGSFIYDVKFRRCNIIAQRGLTVDNARDMDYKGLHADVTEGPVIINK
jgi:polygalacturonase